MRPVAGRAPTAAGPRRRGKRAIRTPPRPVWYGPVMAIASLTTVCLATTLVGWWLVASGTVDRFGTRILQMAVASTSDMGLVVDDVRVVGDRRTKSGDISAKSANIYGHNILLVDIAMLRADLESLPWVRSAAIRRLLPDTLLLEIVEREPFALWRDGPGSVELIDRSGEVIEVADLEPFSRLPVVSGNGARTRAADLFAALMEEADLARRVSGVELVDGRRWNIFLDGRIEVKLPAEDPSDAWRLLARTERRTSLLERAIAAVDLRNPDWLMVRLMEEVTAHSTGQHT